jgi:hypothetical protein
MLSQLGAGTYRCPGESGLVPAAGKGRKLRKMKNRGNEAKKYLKTKDITFLNVANSARFARKLSQI